MKIEKQIRDMPWPEPFEGNPLQHFRMTLSWPVVNHERLLVATFTWNTHKECKFRGCEHKDFRLICSKKLPAAVVLYKGESRGKRKTLDEASGYFNRSCYPEISEQDEKAIARWLGNTIRWNKASIREALRFPTRLLKIHAPENWTMADVQKVTDLWQGVQKGRLQEKDIPELARSMAAMEHIQDALGHASVHKILQYNAKGVEAERERRKKEKDLWNGRPFETPGTYRDYLKDCIALRLNLDDKDVLFPPDLKTAHARTIAEVKYQADAAKKELDINSPSKLFRDKIGYSISEGMALGIRNGIPLVEYASNSLSRASTSAFSGKLAASTGKVSSATGQRDGKVFGKLEINQYINSKAQTAADLMIECRYNAELAVMLGV